ncbi:MAG TPA: CHASE2 domain-containing protein, partial [Chroococcidiopsis sp.]
MALLIGLLFQLGACQPLEHLLYDALFQLRGPMGWGSQVAVIEIDEPSIQKFGRFPWKRDRYAELLTVLTDAQASVVGLDLLLPEPAPEDQALAAAMAAHGRVVLVQDWTQSGMALDPATPLQAAAIATGHVYKREDPDGLTRSLELYRHDLPALALVLAQLYSSPNLPVDFPNPTQPLWLNWFGPTTEAAHYSFAQVLARQVPSKEFRNKIVLVGTNALALDSLQTPYDRNPPTGNVYLQATAVNNILRANALQQPGAGWLVLIWLLGGPGLSVLLARWRFERQVLTWLGLAVGWFCASLLLFYAGWWVPTAMPIALILGTGMAAAFIDQYHTNRLLQQSEERYALAVYGSNEGLWDWNLRTDQLYLSPRWKEMLGYGPSEVGDRIEAWFSRVHSEDLDSLKAAIDDHIHGSTPHFEHEHRIAHHSGSYRWVMSRGIAVRDRNGQTYRLAGSQTDITERREAEDKLRRIALYDELTSLPNRAFFLDTIAKAIARSNLQLFNTYAVLLLDIDRFQVVNSSLGNTVGDQLLVAIAYRLKA